MSGNIILYDLACGSSNTCWSPACWKTRLVLQHKKILFRTIWVSYPDIAKTVGHCQPDNDPPTLPVIKHGETWVVDSWEILLYLEQHFPPTEQIPSLLQPSQETVYFFELWTHSGPVESLLKWILPRVPAFLDERGREYFIRTREAAFGCSLDDLGAGQTIEQVEVALEPVEGILQRYGPFIAGKQVSYQDFVLLAVMQWIDECDPGTAKKITQLFTGGNFGKWYDMMLPMAVTR